MNVLSGIVGDATQGAHGFDCNTKLTNKAIAKFKAAGFKFSIRYVGRKATAGSNDLDASEAEKILEGGLALMVVQHVAREPWAPSESKGKTYGGNAVTQAQNIGIPLGVSLWLDLEGVSTSGSNNDVKGYCNAWFSVVRHAGYVPGVYVGANPGLSGKDLYYELTATHYWKSGSNVPDIPVRGYCMIQRIKAGDEIGGVEIDRNVITDNLPHPKWLIRYPDEQGDVPGALENDSAPLAAMTIAASALHSRRDAGSRAVDAQLPQPATGLGHHYSEDRLWGTRLTIDALLEIGRVWHARHPDAMLSIGDISKKGGGDISGHASHEKGIDLDMRMMKSDGNAAQMEYTSAAYSRSVTQELVDLFYGNGVLAVKLIFFNDAAVAGVQHWPNHDNHLHVRFRLPSETEAYPLVQLNSKGAAVRELQRRLGFWIDKTGNAVSKPSIDGDFGPITHNAVVAYQQAMGLSANGRAESYTWQGLPKSP